MAKHNVSLYRALHHLRKGGLHAALNIAPDKTIPAGRLEKATHSTNPHVKRMALFAKTMSHFKR